MNADDRNDFSAEESDSLSSESSTGDTAQASGAPFFGTAAEVVARYSHCALCGANLHFTHVTDFSKNLTHESAKCPECGVKAHRAIHRLQ